MGRERNKYKSCRRIVILNATSLPAQENSCLDICSRDLMNFFLKGV